MKLGIVLTVLGGFALAGNLIGALAIGEVAYFLTGLALPVILLFFGIRRIRKKVVRGEYQ